MATHSSVLAWRFPETEEPGRLPSIASHRVGRKRLKRLSSGSIFLLLPNSVVTHFEEL